MYWNPSSVTGNRLPEQQHSGPQNNAGTHPTTGAQVRWNSGGEIRPPQISRNLPQDQQGYQSRLETGPRTRLADRTVSQVELANVPGRGVRGSVSNYPQQYSGWPQNNMQGPSLPSPYMPYAPSVSNYPQQYFGWPQNNMQGPSHPPPYMPYAPVFFVPGYAQPVAPLPYDPRGHAPPNDRQTAHDTYISRMAPNPATSRIFASPESLVSEDNDVLDYTNRQILNIWNNYKMDGDPRKAWVKPYLVDALVGECKDYARDQIESYETRIFYPDNAKRLLNDHAGTQCKLPVHALLNGFESKMTKSVEDNQEVLVKADYMDFFRSRAIAALQERAQEITTLMDSVMAEVQNLWPAPTHQEHLKNELRGNVFLEAFQRAVSEPSTPVTSIVHDTAVKHKIIRPPTKETNTLLAEAAAGRAKLKADAERKQKSEATFAGECRNTLSFMASGKIGDLARLYPTDFKKKLTEFLGKPDVDLPQVRLSAMEQQRLESEIQRSFENKAPGDRVEHMSNWSQNLLREAATRGAGVMETLMKDPELAQLQGDAKAQAFWAKFETAMQ